MKKPYKRKKRRVRKGGAALSLSPKEGARFAEKIREIKVKKGPKLK